MQSLKMLYRIGRGPSSSHSMGPARAAQVFKESHPEVDFAEVRLYGSLAKTGKGHMTDKALIQSFAPIPTKVVFDAEYSGPLKHPNTMDITGYHNGKILCTSRVYSIGGAEIEFEGSEYQLPPDIYSENSFEEIKNVCRKKNIKLWQYVEENEGPEIWEYLSQVWAVMCASIDRGLKAEGILAGGLEVSRKAGLLYNQRHIDETPETRESRIVCAYAYAVSEENADGGVVVTAPTCGSSGILPAALRYYQQKKGFTDTDILHGLAAAGIIGNLVKTNASISGAECGCQAEVGTACSMAAAGLAEMCGMSLDQIEYAAEISIEHMLGLTCDPVKGLVQIPCIERNAVAAMRAINALILANFLTNTRKISFDTIVETMYATGRDISCHYRETAEGGLAKYYHK